MNAPRQKDRWSPEQRTAKGLKAQRRGRTEAPAPGAPLNRKQRRALEFGDRPFVPKTDEGSDRPRTDERPARDDRSRDDRPRRDDRPVRDDRPRDDRYSDRSRDDRPARDDRPREDRYSDRSRDDRPRRDDRPARDDRPREDRYSDRSRDDRPRRDDRPARDDRPRWGDRDDRGGDRSGGHRRSSMPPHVEVRRPHEPRGHDDRRGHDRRDTRAPRQDNFDAPEADQMSWTATTAEGVEGDVASGFFELGVAEPLVRVLAGQGISAPFPIQAATIGDAIAGRDVLGRGRTGSGKTLAFGLAMLTRLAEGTPVGSPRAMILTPTRELALQIADVLSPLAAAMRLDLTLIAGGMAYGPQIRAFERGVDVVVATPGRLIDLLEQGAADLSQVQISVLDEADHMADLGFTKEVRTLLDATPEGGQRLLFSATLDAAVDSIVRTYLNDPVTHQVDSSQNSVTTMVHRPLIVRPHHKNQVTAEIANRDGRTVLFARTQLGTDRIAGQLREAGVMAGSLHGGLTQGARARILAAFKDGTVPVLVATDVAARGIHVDDVTLVLQVDPPRDSKDYLHRAGRTARAGQEGVVATVVLPHQQRSTERLLSQAGVRAAALAVEPGSAELREATGARPTSGVEISEADYQRLIAPKQAQRRRPEGGGHGGRRYEGGRGGQRGGRRDRW